MSWKDILIAVKKGIVASKEDLDARIQPATFEGMDAVMVPAILRANGGVIIDPISTGGDVSDGYALVGTVDSDGNPLCLMSLNSDGTIALIGRNTGMVLTDFNAPNYITPSAIGAAETAHNQAASTITAGTLGGQVKANASAQSTLTTAQLRDAVFVAEASAPAVGSTADTSKFPEGCLIAVVEAV